MIEKINVESLFDFENMCIWKIYVFLKTYTCVITVNIWLFCGNVLIVFFIKFDCYFFYIIKRILGLGILLIKNIYFNMGLISKNILAIIYMYLLFWQCRSKSTSQRNLKHSKRSSSKYGKVFKNDNLFSFLNTCLKIW